MLEVTIEVNILIRYKINMYGLNVIDAVKRNIGKTRIVRVLS